MSFLNKLWKNLRDHKSSSDANHGSHKKSSLEQQSSDYSRAAPAAISGNSHSYSQRKSSTLNFRVRKSNDNLDHRSNYDRENIAPPTPSKRQQQQSFTHSKDIDAGLTDDSGFELDNSSEEFQLPPGILSDLAKHPTVSRHLSVSRSGRYKHRNKMRSNLFDVVKRDEDEDAKDLDLKSSPHADHSVSEARQESRGERGGQSSSSSTPHQTHDPRALDHHRSHQQQQPVGNNRSRKGTFSSTTAVDAEVHNSSSGSAGEAASRSQENRFTHPAAHHQQHVMMRREDNNSNGMMMDRPAAAAVDPRHPRHEPPLNQATRAVIRNNGSSHAENNNNNHHTHLSTQSNRVPRRPLPITPPMPPARHNDGSHYDQRMMHATRAPRSPAANLIRGSTACS